MLPTVFISHGSPMHALEAGAAGLAWTALGRRLPRPRAVLIASAHWETGLPMLSTGDTPDTIHDFGGFPPALYTLRYAAPGAPDAARQALALLKAAGLPASANGCRGLDHGAWVPTLSTRPWVRYMMPSEMRSRKVASGAVLAGNMGVSFRFVERIRHRRAGATNSNNP
jgi:4,5-DOPA dioxygenase extradiol